MAGSVRVGDCELGEESAHAAEAAARRIVAREKCRERARFIADSVNLVAAYLPPGIGAAT
jgi:hypothetical protein